MAMEKELLDHLRAVHKGVLNVTTEYGIVCVYTKTRKTTTSVVLDLVLSKAYKSVKADVNHKDGGYVIFCARA